MAAGAEAAPPVRMMGSCRVTGPAPLLRPEARGDGTALVPQAAGLSVLRGLGRRRALVIGSFGPGKAGKSAKLSSMAARLATPEARHSYDAVHPDNTLGLFSTSAEGAACTAGADILAMEPEAGPLIVVVDTEGAGDRDPAYDASLLVLTAYLSDALILHTVGVARPGEVLQSSLERIGRGMADVAAAAAAGVGGDGAGAPGPARRRLVVAVGDTRLRTSSAAETARLFGGEGGDGAGDGVLGASRAAVRAVFPSASAVVLPPPGEELLLSGSGLDAAIDGDLMPIVREVCGEVGAAASGHSGQDVADAVEAWCTAAADPAFEATDPAGVMEVARRVAIASAERECLASATAAAEEARRGISSAGAWWSSAMDDAAAAIREAAAAGVARAVPGADAAAVARAASGDAGGGHHGDAATADAVAVMERARGVVEDLVEGVAQSQEEAASARIGPAAAALVSAAEEAGVAEAAAIRTAGGLSDTDLAAAMDRVRAAGSAAAEAALTPRTGGPTPAELDGMRARAVAAAEDGAGIVLDGLRRDNATAVASTVEAGMRCAQALAVARGRDAARDEAGGAARAAVATVAALEGVDASAYTDASLAAITTAHEAAKAACDPTAMGAAWESRARDEVLHMWASCGDDPVVKARAFVGPDPSGQAGFDEAVAQAGLELQEAGLQYGRGLLERAQAAHTRKIAERERHKPPPAPAAAPAPAPDRSRRGLRPLEPRNLGRTLGRFF